MYLAWMSRAEHYILSRIHVLIKSLCIGLYENPRRGDLCFHLTVMTMVRMSVSMIQLLVSLLEHVHLIYM
jgi:hypothetical protein